MINLLKQKNKNNSGFTLVETLVAISIFTISILALMSVLAKGMSDTNYAKQQMTASYLAQEGIEYIRNMRDTSVLSNSGGAQAGWDAFHSGIISKCMNNNCYFNEDLISAQMDSLISCPTSGTCPLLQYDPSVGKYGYNLSSGEVDSGFTRTISVDNTYGSDEIKIISKVEWTQGSGSHSVTFSENLYNWIQ